MKAGRLFVLLNLLCFSALAQQEEEKTWSLNGYIKDLVTINIPEDGDILFDNLVHNRLNFRWDPNENFGAVLELRSRIFTGDQVRMLPNYSTLIDVNDDYFDLSVIPVDENKIVLHTMLDRAYLSWKDDDWQVSVGRQRINWGINLAWNPNDIFNAYSFFDFDYEERPGSDAIRFQKFIGYAGGYELAVKITDDIDELTAAGMYKWNVGAYDLQVLGGVMRRNAVIGGGWAGSLNLVGFKGEFTFLNEWEQERVDLIASTSLDYAFPNSLYLNAGVLYNSATRAASLFQQSSANLDIRSLSPYTWSTFSQASYPVHPLINTGLAVLLFPGESGVFLNPSATFSVITNLDFDLIGQIFLTSETQSAYFIFGRVKYSF